MKAMILAAGIGSRFRPQTEQLPKPALPFLNVPMGYYSFDFLKNAGVQSLVVNTFHLPEQVTQLYRSQKDFPVEFSHEIGKILGSGGGLKAAESHFKNESHFFLLNSDEILITDKDDVFKKMFEQHTAKLPISTLLVTENSEVGSKFGGVWVDQKNRVLDFGKTAPTGAKKGYHFLGVQVLGHQVFNFLQGDLEQNILYDALRKAMAAGHRVDVFPIQCQWFETGNLQDYLLATENALNALKMKSPSIRGVAQILARYAPHSSLSETDRALVWAEADSTMKNCDLVGFCVLGKNSHLESVQVNHSVIGKNVKLSQSSLKRQLAL